MPKTNKRIKAITRHLPVFAREAFTGGAWSQPSESEMPFFGYDDSVRDFVRDCYEHGWVLHDFDWPAFAATPRAAALRDDPVVLEGASERQLAELLTIVIRQDRFAEGAIAAAIQSGLILKILKRAEQIAAARGGN